MSIRLKILFACLLMTAVTVTLGVFALTAGRQLGQLAIQVYDEAFMSVSLVRSAETRFTALQSLYTAAEAADQAAEQTGLWRSRAYHDRCGIEMALLQNSPREGFTW